MPLKDDQLLKRLRVIFKAEAQEHIQSIASGLLELERAPDAHARVAVLDTTFRAAHSLKGAARTVNVRDIESLCQSLENVFAALKREAIALSAELFDLLHRVVDALGTSLQFIDTASGAAGRKDVDELLGALQAAVTDQRGPLISEPSERSRVVPPVAAADVTLPALTEPRSTTDTIRVATSKLDAVLLQAEEMLSAKLAATQHTIQLRQCRAEPPEWMKKWKKLQPDLRAIRQTLDSKKYGNGGLFGGTQWRRALEFLDWSHEFVESLNVRLVTLGETADHDQRILASMVDRMLDDVTQVVMQPFATLLDSFPRFVRELSREQGKAVELAIRGEDIQIDRRVLEGMKVR